ncbi:MAG: c-type cytochrome [Gammaproteobacteria bacterium]|nr:c-type cytochrome [Gammaproteobacteria bacterium]
MTLGFAQSGDPSSKKEVLLDGYYPAYPQVKTDADPARTALIKQGEYLTKMGDCISCHTNVSKGLPSYTGGLPLKTPFGTFYTPNITPDKETGIGQWTEQNFIDALKHGRGPQGQNLFPVFPYLYFSKVTDEDAKAMYAYFMSIPAVHHENKPQPFPFNMPGARFSLWGWNLLFFFADDSEDPYDPEQTAAWNRGRYIVKGLGHCGMCHTPLSILGAPKKRYFLTGGFVDGFWAPNITKYGLKSASHQQVADVFSTGELINQAGPIAGPMSEVNHNSLQYMTDADRLAIATYLKTVVSEELLGVSPSSAPPSLRRGREVYGKACDVCHQVGVMSAPSIGNAANWYRRLQQNGLTGLYRHTINGYNSMPVKGACVTCSENDLISAVDYILNNSLTRSQWDEVANGGVKQFPASGKEVYNETCAACHNEGKEGAPKIGDQGVWRHLVTKNMDVLILNTLRGEAHPQHGGCPQCTTGEIIEAVKYMVSQSDNTGNYSLW